MRAPQLAAHHVVAKTDRRRELLRVGPAVALDAKKDPIIQPAWIHLCSFRKRARLLRVIIERINDCRMIGAPAQATILHRDHVASRKPCQFARV
jgi:hypothetical protein